MSSQFRTAAQGKFKDPDFAYPQTVVKNAEKLLTDASALNGAEADLMRLRGALEYVTARSSIDRDNAFALPAFLDSLAGVQSTGAGKALMLLVEAESYSRIYSANRWKYNRVDAPLDPLPADVSAWSGEQFRVKIREIAMSAEKILAGNDGTKSLRDFVPVVTYDKISLTYFPTVRLFGYNVVYNLLMGNDEQDAALKICETATAALGTSDPAYYFWEERKLSGNWIKRGGRDSEFAGKIRSLYMANSKEPAARYLLLSHAFSNPSNYVVEMPEEEGVSSEEREAKIIAEQRKTYFENIGILEKSLKDFPDWWGNANLRNTLSDLTSGRVNIKFPSLAAPGKEIKYNVTYTAATKAGFDVYRVPDNEQYYGYKKIVGKLPRIMSVKISGLKNESYKDTTGGTFAISEPGRYALVSYLGDVPSPNNATICFICVSPFVPAIAGGCTETVVYTIDQTTGKPFPGVNVSYEARSDKSTKTLGRTDSRGVLKFKTPDKERRYTPLIFTYKGKRYTFDTSLHLPVLYNPDNEDDEASYNALVMVDRPLYHRGDSIAWSAVVAKGPKGKNYINHAAAGERLTVTLYDANTQKVASINVTTDEFGRATGAFKTAEEGLSGYYTIEVDNDAEATIGAAQVMVSDFKLPTFETSIVKVERNVPAEGCVRISGKAETYTGMPVAGAKVAATINGASWWRWFSPEKELGKLEATTAADGTYTIDVPASMLAEKAYNDEPYTNFNVSVIVTSVTAETASASKNFTTGKPYHLAIDTPVNNVDGAEEFTFTPSALNPENENQAIRVRWEIFPGTGKQPVREGTATTGSKVSVNLDDLKAGQYKIRLSPEDAALADAADATVFTLYNTATSEVPEDDIFFVPKSEFKTGEDGTAEVLIGAPEADTYIYRTFCTGTSLLDNQVEKLGKGFTKIRLTIPEGSDLASATIFAVRNGKSCQTKVTLRRPDKHTATLKAESFRDRLTPGTTETWRFRLVDGAGSALTSSAMTATMYNKALDALESMNWRSFTFGQNYPSLYLNIVRNHIMDNFVHSVARYREGKYLDMPAFRFIDRFNLSSFGGTMIRGTMKRNLLASKAASTDDAIVESEEAVLNDAVTMAYGAAPEAKNEEAMEEESGAGTLDMGDGETKATEDAFDYRVAELLQVFWQPTLVSDSEGNIDLTFTMPNAIGSWTFRAFAWTKELNQSSYVATCLSNKPVMAQPNLPRFLRQGDKATVSANVYNNTDDHATIHTVVEIFDPASGKILSTSESDNTIAAKASAVVSVNVDAPTNMAAVGYRIKSASGNFTDGEQGMIPVLASSQTVVESTEFYLNPTSEDFTLDVPVEKDSEITLQYYQNPIWTVVKAMRGLWKWSGADLATGYASSLFSALSAKKITKDNPAIEAAIRQWSEEPGSEAFTSMLSRNESLKKLLLGSTPWVQTAADQSNRMAQLTDLFSEKAVRKNIAASTSGLKKLQNADGGFVWGGWCQDNSSYWVTENVLTTLGIANSLGMLDAAGLDKEIRAAIGYLDRYERREIQPEFGYTLVHSLFPDVKPATLTGQRVIEATVQHIIANWKKQNTLTKAYCVLILKANGYESVARKVLESIRQFGVVRPGIGMCFPSVDDVRGYATIIQAFAAMGAPAAELDAMRQWITVRAQATDDLGTFNPDYIIASVLLTGSDWTSVPAENYVTVNGQPLEINKTESATGYFAQQLNSAGAGSLKITVRPNGVTPSYGSVVSVGKRVMTSVKAQNGKNLSIRKRILVERDGKWVETDNLRLGERAKVQLLVKAGRDMEYITINDERPSALEPVDQMPGYIYEAGLGFYRENNDATTNIFINYLPAGTYYLTYEMTASMTGEFISGIATVQSQYAPELTAHSAGGMLRVE